MVEVDALVRVASDIKVLLRSGAEMLVLAQVFLLRYGNAPTGAKRTHSIVREHIL